MRIPIWVSAVELECCQPDATVGEPWVASVVCLKPPDPWWAEHAPEPVPEEVLRMGVVDLQGTVSSAALHSEAAIVEVDGLRVIVPGVRGSGVVPVHGRLWLDAHEHPRLQGTPGLEWRGVVRRVRGIRLLYRPVTVYLAIPYHQEPAAELRSTADRDSPETAGGGFAEFLIDLEV